MKLSVYAIRDNKVGFMQPFVDSNDASAMRGFGFAVNGQGVMSYSPADYDLFRVGSFDTDTGKLEEELPVNICSGISVIGEK